MKKIRKRMKIESRRFMSIMLILSMVANIIPLQVKANETYTLTIVNGYVTVGEDQETEVQLAAGDEIMVYFSYDEDNILDKWTGTNGLSILTPNAESTWVTMPSSDATITGTYKLKPEKNADIINIIVHSRTASSAWVVKELSPIYNQKTNQYVFNISEDVTYVSLDLFKYYKDQSATATLDGIEIPLEVNDLKWAPSPVIIDKARTKLVFNIASTDDSTTSTYTITIIRGAELFFPVIIEGGTSIVSEAKPGDIVTIKAAEPESGKVFDKWVSSDGVIFIDENMSETTFTMLDKQVTITANYKDIPSIPQITGSVAISGQVAYGSTITAIIESLQNYGSPLYQWMIDGTEKIGETNNIYKLKEDDIGREVSVKITADGVLGTGSITSPMILVSKADGPSAPTGIEKTDESYIGSEDGIISGLALGQEYQVNNNGLWKDVVESSLIDLSPGNYVIRIKETKTHKAGTATLPLTINQGVKRDGPGISGVSANDATNKMYGMTSLMEFSINGSDWAHYNQLEPNLPDLSGEVTLMVRITETTTHKAGPSSTFNFTVPILESIKITSPAFKTKYQVGEPLDISGLKIAGKYSDGTESPESFTHFNITGFNNLLVTPIQTLTILFGGKQTSYNISIIKENIVASIDTQITIPVKKTEQKEKDTETFVATTMPKPTVEVISDLDTTSNYKKYIYFFSLASLVALPSIVYLYVIRKNKA